MLKKFTFLLVYTLVAVVGNAQPLNDDCINATPVTIPASGNVCINSSNATATTTTWATPVCGQTVWTNDVWFTFISNGSLNTITVQPTGSPAAQTLGVSIWTGGCGNLTGIGTYCAISPSTGGTVTVTQAAPAGTQYWVQVSAFSGDGNFQLCINSNTPPPSPGTSCATAAPICDLTSFNLATGPAGTGAFTPNCFVFGANSSVWYQFTVGTTGTLAWSCTPTLPGTELDWALFDITNGCGTANLNANTVNCNYNYNNQASSPIGMSTGSVTICPAAAANGAGAEFCPAGTVTAGRTYAIFIDNFSNNASGWNFNWTGSTFQMAPTSVFSLNTNKICGNSGSVNITNTSVGASTYLWNFGDGSPTSSLQNPGSHNYTTPGTYLISLTVTSPTGCTDVSSQSIQIIPYPVLTMLGDTICPGQQATISATPDVTGGTYSWSPGGGSTQSINVTPAGNSTYTVTYTSPDNCTATGTANVTVSNAAAFTVSAGSDVTICANQALVLQGSVTPAGSYSYSWSPASSLQNPNSLTPAANPTSNTTYTLQVTDASGCSKSDSMLVTIVGIAVPTTVTATPQIICPGQPVQLDVSIQPVTCGASPPCLGNNISSSIGNDTIRQPGTALQSPTLFGNFLKSGRNQMLYTAAELSAALGGPCIIKAVTFNIKVFNSNAFLQNFTVKMACTNLSSLSTWEQTLTTVYTSATPYQPQMGWSNGIALTTPFAWDGVSNLIIDICWYNPSTFNNQNNKAECSNTAFTSYLYSFSSAANQCGTNTAPTTSTLRPNVRINYCAPDISNYQIAWTPTTGANAVSNSSIHNPTANPVATTNYMVNVDTGQCAGNGVVTVTVDNSTVNAGADVSSCPNAPVTLNATVGGTIAPGPASFVWTTLAGANVGNTQSVTVTPATNTTYVVTLNGGACVKRDTVRVTIGSLSPTATPTNATCFAGNNGKILAASATGTAPFTFTWSANAATGNLDSAVGLAPGAYQVTVTDATGCSGSATATITQPTQVTLSANTINDSCFGGSQGSITASPSGGTGSAYTYSWSSGLPATQTVTGLTANTYTVTVSDANLCTATASYTISEPSQVTFGNPVITNVRCFNGNSGQITVSNAGGNSPYSYSWSHNGTLNSANASGLIAGAYTVTAIDAFGCSVSASYNVSQPASGLTVNISNVTNPTCTGDSDGSATATPNGGVGTIDYLWTPGNQTTATATSLSAATYTVVVTDDSLCTATATVTPVDPPQILISGTVTDVSCFGGSDGAVNATVTNGVPNLSYAWSNGVNTEDISTLTSTSYTLTVIDANSCSATATFSVAEPAELQLTTPSITNVLCFGNNTGSITVTHTGGTGNMSYTWNPIGPNAATSSSLAAGSYAVTITDANGCTDTATYTVTQPATALSFGNPTITDVQCNGAGTGSITVSVSGGTTVATYHYTWSHNAGLNSNTATGLTAGTYVVTVTDDNGCSISASYVVAEPSGVTFGNPAITNVSCFGGSDGSAEIFPTGGTGNFTYTWNGVAGNNPQSGLAANNYTVVLTDASGCTFSTTVSISQPPQIQIAPLAADATCFGAANGSVSSNPSGGTPPYSFVWSNSATSQDITGLVAGAYSVTVTDAGTCTASASTNVNEPVLLTFTTQVTQVKCVGDKNGTIVASPTGGTPPYSYSATMDGSNFFFPVNGTIEGLASGTYTVLVTDNNGCSKTQQVFVPAPVGDTYTITTDSTSCFGSDYADGALHIFGQPIQNSPFQFSVDGGTLQYSGDFNFLKAGSHSVFAVNNFGCDTTLTAIIPEPVNAIAEVLPGDTTLDLGQSIQLASSFSPYPTSTITSYSWSPSTGLSCIDCPNPVATPYAKQTQYELTITYNGHCTASASMLILSEGGEPVYIPNSFSPNGDGNNDIFQIYGAGIKTIDLKVFNRWGEKVYQSNNQFQGWDGTYKGVLQNPSVFAYQVSITYLNDKKVLRTGSITLIK